MKLFNHHRECIGEYQQLSDGTYLIKFNDRVHYQGDIAESKRELEKFLEVRGILTETELGQLNIFDI